MTSIRTLRQLGERGFLKEHLARLHREQPAGFRVPPGDDAAVLAKPKGTVISIDGMVDGIHFKSSWERGFKRTYGFAFPRGLGYKALASALSDLAAMGDVRNRWAMIFLAAPGSVTAAFLADLYRGMRDCAKTYNCLIAGGDTVRSTVLTLSIAVGGCHHGGKILTRNGLKNKDLICATGPIGAASQGLNVLLNKRTSLSAARQRKSVRHFFFPRPRFDAGAVLSRTPGVHAVLDLSDSVYESLLLLAGDQWGVQIEDRVKAQLAASEDNELLVGLSPPAYHILKKRMTLTPVARVTRAFKGLSVKPPTVFSHYGV